MAVKPDDITPEQLEAALASILARAQSASVVKVVELGSLIDELLDQPGATAESVIDTILNATDMNRLATVQNGVRGPISASVELAADSAQKSVYEAAGLSGAGRWVAVIDKRTCDVGLTTPDGRGGGCSQRHGEVFTEEDLAIIGAPRHLGTVCGVHCRCAWIPVEVPTEDIEPISRPRRKRT